MKKGWKIFGIVCAVLAGLGIVLCIAGLAIGFNTEEVREIANRDGLFGIHSYETHTKSDVKNLESSETEVYDNIRNLDVEVGRMQVNVITDADIKGIRVGSETPKHTKFRCYREYDTLKIENEGNDHRIKHEGIINIYIPKDMVFDEADFSIGAGVLHVQKINARELDIECGAGTVELTAAGRETDYNYELEMGAGEITIGGGTFSGVGMEKNINNQAAKEMSIECGAGEVTINFE